MCLKPEEYSYTQTISEIENKKIIKTDCFKDDSTCISVNSQITANNSRTSSVKILRKNQINKIQNSFTSISFLSDKRILNLKKKFFPEKESSDFDLLIVSKEKENKENEKIKEMKENKVINIEIKENKDKIKEEDLKKNVNNIKNNFVNRNTCLKTNENYNINKNIQKNIKKGNDINNNYTQTYTRNDFSDKPPKVSRLFMDIYDYESKNIFSHSNGTCGNIKETKKIPNIFYDHLLINNGNKEKYITASLNKRNHGKLSTFIYYAPRTVFA